MMRTTSTSARAAGQAAAAQLVEILSNGIHHSYIVSENLLIRFGKGNLPCLRCIEIVKSNFLIIKYKFFVILSCFFAIFFDFMLPKTFGTLFKNNY